MPFRPIIPLLPLPKTGLLSRLTAPVHTPEIANALLLADFPRAASIIANAGPDALDKARPKLNQLLEDILVQIASRVFQPEGLTESSRGVKRVFERHPRTAAPQNLRTPKGCRRLAAELPRANSRANHECPPETSRFSPKAHGLPARGIPHAIADGTLSDPEFDRIKELAKRPIVAPPFRAVSSVLHCILWPFENLALCHLRTHPPPASASPPPSTNSSMMVC